MERLQTERPIKPDDLISQEYLQQQVLLHAAPRGYGEKGSKWAGAVAQLAAKYKCDSVLDYGCGSGSLAMALRAAPLGLDVREYDPAILGKHELPEQADLVVCSDVLEHIEPDRLWMVLAHLDGIFKKVLFLVIATRPASKTLADGRNAHLIIEDADWWKDRLTQARFLVLPGPESPSKKPSREVVVVIPR